MDDSVNDPNGLVDEILVRVMMSLMVFIEKNLVDLPM